MHYFVSIVRDDSESVHLFILEVTGPLIDRLLDRFFL